MSYEHLPGSKFLPPIELAIKRRKTCKPWAIGLIVFLVGPAALVFSYRQRIKDYALVFFGISAFIIGMRVLFPNPPEMGAFVLPLFRWLIYSKYGPMIIHGYGAFYIADSIKNESLGIKKDDNFIKNSKDIDHSEIDYKYSIKYKIGQWVKAIEDWADGDLFQADRIPEQENRIEKLPLKQISEASSFISNKEVSRDIKTEEFPRQRLEELKALFDKGLISEEEYETLRKKTLGL